nr:MAG TPA: hypothetical protein [Caudoviricetes sp.]
MESSAREKTKNPHQLIQTKKTSLIPPRLECESRHSICATARDLEDVLFENSIVELLRVTDLT